MTTDRNTCGPRPTSRRLRRALGGAAVCALAFAGATGVASAAPTHVDAYAFSAHVYIANPGAATSRFLLVADTCTVRTDGGAPAPCSAVGPGTLTASGGTVTPVFRAPGHVSIVDESFTFTGPTTSTGTGSAATFGFGLPRPGAFAGNFTVASTASPNVLLDSGTVTITY